MELYRVVLLLVAFGALMCIYYISVYNKIQSNIIRINEAESEIDDSLRKMLDILKELEKIINEKTNLKQNNFDELSESISNFDIDRIVSKASTTFKKIKSDYSDKLDYETYNNLETELMIREEKCESSKAYYNKFTTKLNLLIKKFPTNIISRIHGVNERLYFDNKNMNDDDILDFKI